MAKGKQQSNLPSPVDHQKVSGSVEDEIDKALREIAAAGCPSANYPGASPSPSTEACLSDVVDLKALEEKDKLQRRRQSLAKKCHSKIGILQANRRKECLEEDNVKYDKRGRRIGRMQKQMVHVPSGNLNADSLDLKNLQGIVNTLASQPDQLDAFMQRLGITPEQFDKMKNELQTKASTSATSSSQPDVPQFERIEEILE